MFNSSATILLFAWIMPTAFSSVCRPLSIGACYRSRAMDLLRDLVKPPFGEIDQDTSMERICTTRFPSQSDCVSIVNDCPLERQDNFTYLEDAYKVFHRIVCTESSFEGLRSLWDCLDRPRRKKCDRSDELLRSPVSWDDVRQCNIARNYSQCLRDVTLDIPPKCEDGKRALMEIAAATVDIMCRKLSEFQPKLPKSPFAVPENHTTIATRNPSAEYHWQSSDNVQGSTSPESEAQTSDELGGIINTNDTSIGKHATSALVPSRYTTPSSKRTVDLTSAVTSSSPVDEGIPRNTSMSFDETSTEGNAGGNTKKEEQSQEPNAASMFSSGVLMSLLYTVCLLYVLHGM